MMRFLIGVMTVKNNRLEIIESFMAQTDNRRRFHGTIRRETDADGNPVVFGNIKMADGHIIATASDQWELGERLDDMVLLVLDYALHSGVGATSEIADMTCFLN